METSQPTNSRSYFIVLWCALLSAFYVCLVALTLAQDDGAPRADSEVQKVQTEILGPESVLPGTVRFDAVDVFVDSGDQRLAAWQLKVECTANDVQIVGIEGGEHPAFAEPPYYDKRAMNNNRVICAAFSTGDDLPSGRSRVARIHVQIRGSGSRTWLSELTTSATTDGTRIPAEVSISKAGR